MKIDKFKRWYQVRNTEGHVVFQTLNENEARLFAGFPVNFPASAMHLGEEPVFEKEDLLQEELIYIRKWNSCSIK